MEQGFDVSASVDHVKDQDVAVDKLVEDDVVAHWKAAQTRSQFQIAVASQVWVVGKNAELAGNGIDEAIRNFNVAALGCQI